MEPTSSPAVDRITCIALSTRPGHQQAGLGSADTIARAAAVLWFAIIGEDGKIDPLEARRKPAAPDDIGDVEWPETDGIAPGLVSDRQDVG